MSWDEYYEKSKDRPLRALYTKAIQFLHPSAKQAVDLGCGLGTEVLDLLERGLEVHAVDQEPKSMEWIDHKIKTNRDRLHTHLSQLENWKAWPRVDFLFACHSFPFCHPDQFDLVIERSLLSVTPNGIFAASLFGPEDEWVVKNSVVGISSDKLKKKLYEFEILYFDEIKETLPTVLEGNKMSHIIDVIARRK